MAVVQYIHYMATCLIYISEDSQERWHGCCLRSDGKRMKATHTKYSSNYAGRQILRTLLNAGLFGTLALPLACSAQTLSDSSTAANTAAPAEDSSEVFELGELIVVGMSQSYIGTLRTNMDAALIKDITANNVARALTALPGVTLTRFGPRNEEAVYVRGFDRTSVPIYVDGVPVCVPYDGFADLARFTTSGMSSITLSKGYSSVLSGPNAFGGVINIVSSKPVEPMEFSSSFGVYSGTGRRLALRTGTRQGRWFAEAAASYDEKDYFPLPGDYETAGAEDGGNRNNSYEKDWKISAKVGYTPNGTDEYVIGLLHQEAEKGTPPYGGSISTTSLRYWQWPEWNKSTVYFTSITHFGASYIRPRFYYDRYDNTLKSFDDATYSTMNKKSSFTSIYDDYSYGASIEAGTDEIDHVTIKVAIHNKTDHHDEHNVGYPHYVFEDNIWSSGIELTTRFKFPLQLQAGLGYDCVTTDKAVDSNTGLPIEGKDFDSLNPVVALFYDMKDAGALHLSVARKSRFPTIKDRYSYKMGTAIPNPELEPESVVHYEFGYAGSPRKGLGLSASVFISKISDTIESVANAATNSNGTWVSQNRNVGESENSGFEAALRYEASDSISFGGTYTYLTRKNISSPHLKPTYTPRDSGTIYADYRPLAKLSLLPYIELSGKRYTDTSGANVDSYVAVSLKAEYRLSEHVRFDVGVRNLFDCLYAYQEGYPEPGRVFFTNIHYRY